MSIDVHSVHSTFQATPLASPLRKCTNQPNAEQKCSATMKFSDKLHQCTDMYSRSQPLSFQPFNLLRTLKNSLPNQFQFPRSGILSKFRPDSTLKRKAIANFAIQVGSSLVCSPFWGCRFKDLKSLAIYWLSELKTWNTWNSQVHCFPQLPHFDLSESLWYCLLLDMFTASSNSSIAQISLVEAH